MKSQRMVKSILRFLLILGIAALHPNCDGNGKIVPPKTGQAVIDESAAWSPDGTKIIFFRHPPNGVDPNSRPWGVFMHFVDKGTDSLLWPSQFVYDFSWSPDGKQIAYSRGGQIFVRDLVSEIETQITFEGRNFECRWSPCGDKIAYCRRTGEPRGLYFYYLNGAIHRLVLPFVESADWASNCIDMAVLSYAVNPFGDIGFYDTTDASAEVIAATDRPTSDVTISPTGESIIYSIQSNLWIVDITERVPRQLTSEGGDYSDWSPDGEWIVFTEVNYNNGYLWLMRPDGSDRHQITAR